MNKSDFQSPKQFDIMPISDAQDRADDCNCKLKCMGTMLAVADLECFGDGHPNGENLRYGLSCIILEIAEEHEKNIELLRADYERCPESIIETATRAHRAILNGRYEDTDQALKQLDEEIGKLDSVVITFGDEYPTAKDIRGRLLDLKKQISASPPVAGQEMRQAG